MALTFERAALDLAKRGFVPHAICQAIAEALLRLRHLEKNPIPSKRPMKNFKPECITQLVTAVQRDRELRPQVAESDRELAAVRVRVGDTFNEIKAANHRIRVEYEANEQELTRLLEIVGHNANEIQTALQVVTSLRAALCR